MKIIIHFGPPKTGTSAIQAWCSENTEVLLSYGIFYPKHKLNNNKISSGNLFSIFDKDTSGSYAVNDKKIKVLLEEAEEKHANTILLSSEFFFLLLPKIIDVFPAATYIGYIRNPLEVLDSNYNQSVKRHGNTSKIPLTKHINCNSIKHVETYLNKYPELIFELRAYTPSTFINNSIVNDFLSVLSVDETADASNKLINTSYTHSALEAKRWFNRLKLGKLQSKLDTILQAYEGGKVVFTVIPDNYFNKYKSQVLGVLTNFTQKYPVDGAESLLLEAQNGAKPIYLAQELDINDFKSVVKYIKKTAPKLYAELKSSVLDHYGNETLEERALIFYEENEVLEEIRTAYKRIFG